MKEESIPTRYSAVCRAWDKASTFPSDVNRYPDYTACVKMYRTEDGDFWITGEHHHSNHDEFDKTVFGRFRHRPGRRDLIISKQAAYDGENCVVVLPIDPGSAGVTEFTESAKKLSGFIVKSDKVATSKSKLQKFSPFSAAVENGIVHIVENTFSKESLAAFYKELESFDGSPSTRQRHDDWVDACSTAYNYLCKAKKIPFVVRNQIENTTIYNNIVEKR